MCEKYLTLDRLNKITGITHAFATRTCENMENILPNPDRLFTVKQVHGDKIYIIDSESKTPKLKLKIEADAILTNIKNFPIGVLTADCLPIILADVKGRVAGIIHAGRVGTSLEISKKAVIKIKDVFNIPLRDVIAGIGPGICKYCYEVDEKSISPFKQKLPYCKEITIQKGNGKWMLNLKVANKIQLIESGLKPENIVISEFCTSCRNDKFFSYRKEGKKAGRMISFVALRK